MEVNTSSHRMFYYFRIIVVVLISMTCEMNAYLINVALSKGTVQSSTKKHEGGFYQSSLAVDGVSNRSHGVCARTGYDYQPFWEVDLGTSYVIAFIKVYGRLGICCAHRLSDVEVNVSTDHVTYALYGYHPGAINSTFKFHPQHPIFVGRWVKISLMGKREFLTLCEVEVMTNMTYSRDIVHSIRNVEGTSAIIKSISVVSKIQCVFHCFQIEACHSVNVRQNMMSPFEMECQLLNHVSYRTTSDQHVVFWTRATNYVTYK